MASETKSELVDELSSHSTKAELVELLGSRLKKDEIEKALAARDDSDEDEEEEEDGDDRERQSSGPQDNSQPRDDETELDWNAELEWSPPPQPTPAPVAYVGAAPYLPGARVRVDLSGLPYLGIFLGKGASAAGTIVGVNARERSVRIYLDACFEGEKEILLPPERVVLDR